MWPVVPIVAVICIFALLFEGRLSSQRSRPSFTLSLSHNLSKRIAEINVVHGEWLVSSARFNGCLVDACALTNNIQRADLVVISPTFQTAYRPPGQIWVFVWLEPPTFTVSLHGFEGLVNWTATYRTDSTIVYRYGDFRHYANYSGKLPMNSSRDFSAAKTRLAAWFVSRCGAPSNRDAYVRQLQKYVDIDIYGNCGKRKCPRQGGGADCFRMLKKTYFFYLAFENSNCQEYITEKLFNALSNDVIPVVMGASRRDYEKLAPPESFIHVDDFATPGDLAKFMSDLSADTQRYNSYFRWKSTGSLVDTTSLFWCQLCAMLHDADRARQHSVHTQLDSWWRGPDDAKTCRQPMDSNYALWHNDVITNRSGFSLPKRIA